MIIGPNLYYNLPICVRDVCPNPSSTPNSQWISASKVPMDSLYHGQLKKNCSSVIGKKNRKKYSACLYKQMSVRTSVCTNIHYLYYNLTICVHPVLLGFCCQLYPYIPYYMVVVIKVFTKMLVPKKF